MSIVAFLALLLPIVTGQTGEWQLGRGSFYGPTDQFKSDWGTGTCRCWSSDSYRPDVPCFDDIVSPSYIAAVDTAGMQYTGTCGTCLEIRCTTGPTRGLASSMYPEGACKGEESVIVQVTDSCPCEQNESNRRWCCQDTARGVRHLDIAEPAFLKLAQQEAGVIDVLFRQIPCTPSIDTGAEWDTWEAEYDRTLQVWSETKSNTLASVQSACGAGVQSAGLPALLATDKDIADSNRSVSPLIIGF